METRGDARGNDLGDGKNVRNNALFKAAMDYPQPNPKVFVWCLLEVVIVIVVVYEDVSLFFSRRHPS